MNYLVPTNSAEENFNLMAKGIWTTQEASLAKQNFDGKGFGKTIALQLAATITSLA